MNANQVLHAMRSAEGMCYYVIDFCHENEELLPGEYKFKDSRMHAIMRGLDYEYNAVELDNEEDIKRIHEYAKGVFREAASTLAKLKALSSACKQEIDYSELG